MLLIGSQLYKDAVEKGYELIRGLRGYSFHVTLLDHC